LDGSLSVFLDSSQENHPRKLKEEHPRKLKENHPRKLKEEHPRKLKENHPRNIPSKFGFIWRRRLKREADK
jgi:hypothetical protein